VAALIGKSGHFTRGDREVDLALVSRGAKTRVAKKSERDSKTKGLGSGERGQTGASRVCEREESLQSTESAGWGGAGKRGENTWGGNRRWVGGHQETQ